MGKYFFGVTCPAGRVDLFVFRRLRLYQRWVSVQRPLSRATGRQRDGIRAEEEEAADLESYRTALMDVWRVGGDGRFNESALISSPMNNAPNNKRQREFGLEVTKRPPDVLHITKGTFLFLYTCSSLLY